MKEQKISSSSTQETLLKKDGFSAWLGLKIDDQRKGYCKLHYTIREEMLNGFGIVHGGILFSAADSAFAFACNAHGYVTVALEASISFMVPVRLGAILTVEATEIHRGNKTGFYEVRITNKEEKLVAVFKGTAYQTTTPSS